MSLASVHWSPEYARDQITLNNVRLGWIASYNGEINAAARELRHPHAPSAYWHLSRGKVAVKYHSIWYQANAGYVIMLPAGAREHAFSSDAKLTSIRFDLVIKGSATSHYPTLKKPLILPEAEVDPSWLSLSRTLSQPSYYKEYPELERFQEYIRWLAGWLCQVRSQSTNDGELLKLPPLLVRAQDQLANMDLTQPFTETSLARRLDVSKNHLRRLFREHGLGSPTRLLEQRKEEEAVQLLNGTKYPVQLIADGLGFSSSSHFGYWFKKRRGLTPLQFRKHMRDQLGHPV